MAADVVGIDDWGDVAIEVGCGGALECHGKEGEVRRDGDRFGHEAVWPGSFGEQVRS